jgi:protein-tyrosine phosphatase
MASPIQEDGRIPLPSILNLRDVGQHVNHLSGTHLLRPGLFFRSARPDTATPADQAVLKDHLGIKTIIDLRTPTEHAEQARKHPGPLPQIEGVEYVYINFNGSSYSNALIGKLSYWNTAKLYGLYVLGYRKEAISVLGTNVMAARGLAGLAEDSLRFCQAEVKQVFDVLCQAEKWPVLVHCTQGKDRTGLVVLLVLMLLGVEERVIGADYRLSQGELQRERAERLEEIRSIGLPEEFADCDEGWTDRVCGFINEEFGSVEMYLKGCGVTAEHQEALKRINQKGFLGSGPAPYC